MIALRNVRRVTGGVQAVEPRVEKALPNADEKFLTKAESFAEIIAKDAAKYNITERDAKILTQYVKAFRTAFNAARTPGSRTVGTIRAKDDARKDVEEWLRAIRNQIRGDGSITRGEKILLGIKERSKKLGKRECPTSPPVLRFLCGIDGEGSSPGVHVIDFRELHTEGTSRKPVGAAQLFLYFDLIPVGEPIPKHPAERGWPKFLNHYTRSPMHVEFPMPMSGPMLLVYWGRWADAKGNAGPWSETCVARIEGSLATVALPEPRASSEWCSFSRRFS